jgi:hypothetical protein
MAHVMLVATGRWSRGWWDYIAGWLKLVFSSLLLDVILNQNLIIINSTNFWWDKEMWWQLETLIEASDAWAPQKWLNQVFLSTLFAKTNRRLHYVEKGTSAHSLLQSYSNFNKQTVFILIFKIIYLRNSVKLIILRNFILYERGTDTRHKTRQGRGRDDDHIFS